MYELLGSDIINDGMYLELHDNDDNIVATVFRSDLAGEYEIVYGPASAPTGVINAFIKNAKNKLADRANTHKDAPSRWAKRTDDEC